MATRRSTRSTSRGGATPRGGRTGGRGGRGGGRGTNNNDINDGGNPDFAAIIAQQLQDLLPTIVTQVDNHRNNSGNHGNGNGNGETNDVSGSRNNNNNGIGCTYKEFTACKPIDFDGKGGALVYTRWVEKMESVIDISNCAPHQKVKYSACSLSGKALTWWNTQVQARGRESAIGMTWDDFKALLKEEYCPDNEMQKLEHELYHLSMVGADHATYTDRFHELARLVPHLVTPESKRIERYIYGLVPEIRGTVKATEPATIQSAILRAGTLTDEMVRNGTLKTNDKRKGMSESNEQKGKMDDHKKARAFAATSSDKKEYMGPHPKCAKCNWHHQKTVPCRVCTNCKQPGHSANWCKAPANANNMRNNPRVCYECNSPDHLRNTCPRLNRAPKQGNLALAIEGINPNTEPDVPTPRGRCFYLGDTTTRDA